MVRDDIAVWMLGLLEAAADQLGIQVRYESLDDGSGEMRLRSGACRIRGRDVIIVEKDLSPIQKGDVLVAALKRFDFSGVYLPPAVRARLDE